MYVGSLGNFFYKDKEWVNNQPKITKDNKFHYILMGGKIFKLDIYSGELYEIKKSNNKILFLKTLSEKRNHKHLDLMKNKTNTNININKEKKDTSSINKNILNLFKNKTKKELCNKRNKSSNVKTNFSLSSRNYYNKTEKFSNFYLNRKYVFSELTKKSKKRKRISNVLTFDGNNNKSLRNKFHNFPLLNIKKTNNNDDDNLFIQEDICEITKEDNGIITQVKNRIFKDKIFEVLKKKYQFFEKNKNSILNIPKLKLDTAQHLYIHTKSSILKKINFNKMENKKKIEEYNYKANC